MQITGKIIEKLPLKTGVGQRGPWAIAQLVVEFADGQYTTNVCLQNANRAEEFNALPIGAFGKFDFSVSSRKGQQGGWFTSCNCFKWEVNGGAAAAPAAPAAPAASPKDDLPF